MQRECCTRIIIRTNFEFHARDHAQSLALGAGRGREHERYELACKSREVPRFLALEPVGFSTTAAYSFVFAVWGAIRFASLYEKYLLVPQRWRRIAVKGIYRHNFRPVHF